jgi:YfiH family protein
MHLWPKNVKYKIFDRSFINSTHYYNANDQFFKDEAIKNLALVKKSLEVEKLIVLNQTHSNKVIAITDINQNYSAIIADGSITMLPNIALAIYTADCVPVIITNFTGTIVAALHVGRLGALNNIISNFRIRLSENFEIYDQLFAILGPCINQKSYEVNFEIYSAFISKAKEYKTFFTPQANHKFLFDLQGLVNYQLNQINVITKIKNINTYDNTQFFSYRNASKNGVIESRRILTSIYFK